LGYAIPKKATKRLPTPLEEYTQVKEKITRFEKCVQERNTLLAKQRAKLYEERDTLEKLKLRSEELSSQINGALLLAQSAPTTNTLPSTFVPKTDNLPLTSANSKPRESTDQKLIVRS
jgi:hypothetical protein